MKQDEEQIPASLRQKAQEIEEIKASAKDLLMRVKKVGINGLEKLSLEALLSQVSDMLIEGSLQGLNTFVSTLFQDHDREERLRIHSRIGSVLAKELKIAPEAGKVVSYHLMDYGHIDDLAVDGQSPPVPPQDLLARAENLLLRVTVRYEYRPARSESRVSPQYEQAGLPSSHALPHSDYARIIEIYLLRPGDDPESGSARIELSDEIAHDDILSHAREQNIRNKHFPTYKLFPRRAS